MKARVQGGVYMVQVELADGTVGGGVNQGQINFYNSFINELIQNGKDQLSFQPHRASYE